MKLPGNSRDHLASNCPAWEKSKFEFLSVCNKSIYLTPVGTRRDVRSSHASGHVSYTESASGFPYRGSYLPSVVSENGKSLQMRIDLENSSSSLGTQSSCPCLWSTEFWTRCTNFEVRSEACLFKAQCACSQWIGYYRLKRTLLEKLWSSDEGKGMISVFRDYLGLLVVADTVVMKSSGVFPARRGIRHIGRDVSASIYSTQ
jgi:hypothetical protein